MTITAVGGILASSYLLYRSQKSHSDPDESSKDAVHSKKQRSLTTRMGADVLPTCTTACSSTPTAESLLPGHVKREILKERRRRKKMEEFSCKKPVYDNMRMYDPKGRLLSTISKKKANWYINKKLATWANDHHTAIRLNFEPKGGGDGSDGASSPSFHGEKASDALYLKSNKANRCCCCGSEEHIRRHYVVPIAYRRQFPSQFKSHLSSDIVIMCGHCHIACNQYYQQRMKELEDECDVDKNTGLPVPHEPPYLVDSSQYHIRSCALALLRWRERIPGDKVAAYERVVGEYLGISTANNSQADAELTSERLQQVIDVDYRKPNPFHVPAPERVVAKLNNDNNQMRFNCHVLHHSRIHFSHNTIYFLLINLF